jgi:hypothetical protein
VRKVRSSRPWADLQASARGNLTSAWLLLQHAFSREQNPFLEAELRAQARRPAFPRALLLQSASLVLLFVYLLWLAKQPWQNDPFGVQRLLGRHLLTGVAGLHGWMVLHASNSRTLAAARREETARMWEMLLVTPLSASEIVLFKSVYPAFYAGLVALLALPVYLLAAAVSGVPFSQLAMLYVVYALLTVRLVAPLRPPTPGRGRGGRRPRHAAQSFGSLFTWIWLLNLFLGRALRPLSPLGSFLVISWPVMAALVLSTPYAFYRWALPPLVALLALGVPLLVLGLRWATRRLLLHASEAPEAETPSRLRRGVAIVTALVALGYAWPGLIEGGGLSAWMRQGSAPADSIADLAWVLTLLWWLLFGVGSLLGLSEGRLEAGEGPPRRSGGWLGDTATTRGALRALLWLLLPPYLVLVLGCLLSGRSGELAALSRTEHLLVVAAGAAGLTVALARRARTAAAQGEELRSPTAWLLPALLIAAPLFLLFWPDVPAFPLAALSPLVGFLRLLPPTAPLSSEQLASLPWWLSPALNAGAAALLDYRRPARAPGAAASEASARRRQDGRLTRWVEGIADRWDQPVLIHELRAAVRRGDGWRIVGWLGCGGAFLLCLSAFSPGTVTGLATNQPFKLVPGELEGARQLAASVPALLILGLSWPMVFSAPMLGAGSFSRERRKGTLGFLLLTPLREAEIVRQKLISAVAPLLLVLTATFPLAVLAALLSLSTAALWMVFFSYAWLLIACLTGGSFGLLASLVLPGQNDPQGPPVLVIFLVQIAKLWAVVQLQSQLGDTTLRGLEITAFFVVPLVAVEALLGYVSYSASISLLARARHRDVRFVTEK